MADQSERDKKPLRSYERGKLEAQRDIAAGEPLYQVFGYPAPETRLWEALLRERCGVRLNRLAGCVVGTSLISYARAYNEEVKTELERRFGVGILDRLWQEASEQFEEQLRSREQRASEE